MSVVPQKIVLKSTTKISLNDRFSAIKPVHVANPLQIRQQITQQRQGSAKNRRLALQMANRPTFNLNQNGPVQAAKRLKQRIKQRLGSSSIKNRLDLTAQRGGIRGRGRGRGINRINSAGSNVSVNQTRGGFNNAMRGRGGRGRGSRGLMRPFGSGTGGRGIGGRGGRGSDRGFGRGRGRGGRFNSGGPIFGRGGRGAGRGVRGTPRGRRPWKGARGGAGRGGTNGVQMTKEQLDSQLDTYMSKTKAHLDAELDAYMAEAE